MDGGRFSISADVLSQRIGAAAPIVIDSRRAPAFDADGWIIVGGICCPPNEMAAWQRDRTDNLPVVVSPGLRHQRWRQCRRVYAGAPLVKWRMASTNLTAARKPAYPCPRSSDGFDMVAN